MHKNDLIQAVSESTGLTPDIVKDTVSAVFDTIITTLKHNESVIIPGFGTFKVRLRASRVGRNPRTGDTININASTAVVFKQAKLLRDSVNPAT